MSKKLIDAVFVGCGIPKRSMGWVHLYQCMNGQIPHANVVAAVDSWLLGPGRNSSEDFKKLQESSSFSFFQTVDELPRPNKPSIAVVSTRTPDMPDAVNAIIDKGFSHIYLEKPGASDTASLENMHKKASASGVEIMMGYNKNVAEYVRSAMDERKAVIDAGLNPFICFEHSNAFTQETLPDCLRKNSEGMLRNMACHELALVVSLFDINPSNLKSVVAHPSESDIVHIDGITDFSNLGFTLENEAGTKVKIVAKRCGGQGAKSYVGEKIFDVDTPQLLQRMKDLEDEIPVCFYFDVDTPQLLQRIKDLEDEIPGMISYFYPQWDDYINLKSILFEHVANGLPGLPSGVVSIEQAVDVLKLCDSLTAQFNKDLQHKA